jgi:hypothetical protein
MPLPFKVRHPHVSFYRTDIHRKGEPRRVDESEFVPLSGTEGALMPFFSPDVSRAA